MKLMLLLACLPLSAATITFRVGCSALGGPVKQGAMACSSDVSSASAVFMPGPPFPDLRVDTSATNPASAQAELHYDAMWNLTVTDAGAGTGFVEPIMSIFYTPEPAIFSDAFVRFGIVEVEKNSIGSNHQFNFAQPVVFGQTMQIELKLDVDASTGFALFPPWVQSANSSAEATITDLWLLDASFHRTRGTVTFTEVAQDVPEPGYWPVFWIGWLAVMVRWCRSARQCLK